jgi:hypothetical protein
MKLQSFLLRSFTDPSDTFDYPVDVPAGSIFLKKTYITHEGIYLAFAVPEMIVEGSPTDRYNFSIVLNGMHIPGDSELIAIEDAIVSTPENPEEQVQVLFPIFQIHKT